MEGITVKAVELQEEKSIQEVENELLEVHEAKYVDSPEGEESGIDKIDLRQEPAVEAVQEEVVEEQVAEGIKEEDLVNEIKSRLGIEINSLEDLKAAREDNGEMDEEMAAFFKYKKETGRGIQDFMKLNEDYSSLSSEEMIAAYLRETEMEEGMDDDDLEVMLQDYLYDEELDDEDFIKKTRLKQKKIVAKAKSYFEEAKEKYKIPAESVGDSSLNTSDEYQAYKQYLANAKNEQDEIKRRRDWFVDKTNQVFNQEFKGFEFNIGERSLVYSPADKDELRKLQDSPMPWIQKHTDEQGLLTNAHDYHRSLAMAMNPEKFAEFFYEQGKAEAVDDLMKKTKNVNMSDRSVPQVAASKGGMQVRAVSPSSGRGLKIRSSKNRT
jgi:hypothetical protein